MDLISNEIRIGTTDREINALLEDPGSSAHIQEPAYTMHFNQSEEFFLRLKKTYTVPHLPIHHDIREPKPSSEYLQTLGQLMADLVDLAPMVFQGHSYLFDPGDILRPNFFRLYRFENSYYLHLIKLDLLYRAQDDTIEEKGSNDITPVFTTRHLFVDSLLIPIEHVELENDKLKAFYILQTISQTWIGETGRGYFVQGIWMDDDLTKFFSKLFLPSGKRFYPFYPFICRYKTICQTVAEFTESKKQDRIPLLHQVLKYLNPSMNKIERSIKNGKFSEDLEIFQDSKKNVPASLQNVFNGITMKVYLNEQDMREFELESTE